MKQRLRAWMPWASTGWRRFITLVVVGLAAHLLLACQPARDDNQISLSGDHSTVTIGAHCSDPLLLLVPILVPFPYRPATSRAFRDTPICDCTGAVVSGSSHNTIPVSAEKAP